MTEHRLLVMLRVGVSLAAALRGQVLMWVLSTIMPFIMLALWDAVAREGPVDTFTESHFITYFLVMYLVSHLTGSWMGWQISEEIRTGMIALRLLRPIHPLFTYAVDTIAEWPVRNLIALPLAVVLLVAFGRDGLTSDPVIGLLSLFSVVAAWLITLFLQLTIGCLAFFTGSSATVGPAYAGLYFTFSGYVVPIMFFPDGLRAALNWLPFRYQLGLPVELLTGTYSRTESVHLFICQWLMVGATLALALLVWRRGLMRFSASGG